MHLKKYREKRKFSRTPEPEPEEISSGSGLPVFVIQKHWASRLHYDFRVEVRGALKSWAIPKGLSLDPNEKHLAIEVEEHPLEYRNFEGIIPSGNYGAGAVIIWDEGTYTISAERDKHRIEEEIAKGIIRGVFSLRLHGKKINGEFSFIRSKKITEQNHWLVIKKEDEFSTTKGVFDERSVISGDTVEALRKIYEKKTDSVLAGMLKGLPSAEMPHRVRPMLSTLSNDVFDRNDWYFEIKWDGYRALAEIGEKGIVLYSRNLELLNEKFADIVASLRMIGHEVVLDGEIVILDESGRPRFDWLQSFIKKPEGVLAYMVFDILFIDGYSTIDAPLYKRKLILKHILPTKSMIKFSDHIKTKGERFFFEASRRGLEGIIAKDSNSQYFPGRRTGSWLKIKTRLRQDAVIVGYTQPKGSRKHIGALVLGVYEGEILHYIGHTGGGFDEKKLSRIKKMMEPLKQDFSSFREIPKTNAPVQWVKPNLVCEVVFHEWTENGIMRQPVFIGLREDKKPQDVKREFPVARSNSLPSKK